MSSPAWDTGPAIQRVNNQSFGDRLLLRNDDDSQTVLTVVRRRGDFVATDTICANPRATYSVTLPPGTGTTLVDVHSEETTATTSVGPSERPPLFSYRDGAVLVTRD